MHYDYDYDYDYDKKIRYKIGPLVYCFVQSNLSMGIDNNFIFLLMFSF